MRWGSTVLSPSLPIFPVATCKPSNSFRRLERTAVNPPPETAAYIFSLPSSLSLRRPTYDVWPDLCWESGEGRSRKEGGKEREAEAAEEGTTATVAVQQLLSSLLPPSLCLPLLPSGCWIALARGRARSVSECVRAWLPPLLLAPALVALSLSPSLPPSQLLSSFPFYRVSFSPPPSSFFAAAAAEAEARAANSRIQDPRFVRSLSDGCVRFLAPFFLRSFLYARGSRQKLSPIHCFRPRRLSSLLKLRLSSPLLLLNPQRLPVNGILSIVKRCRHRRQH